MRLPRLALLALLLAGCTVPSLSDLEKEKPRACDDTHKCLSGYSCVAGVCQKGGAPECSPGTTESCGTDKGECVAGTRTCGQDGKWGSCQGEVAAVQEVCDGKDNDCDGTDDDSPQTNSCGVNVGVCANKTRACIAGSEEATCSVLSFGGEYQAGGETVCDGKDNDCDGPIDENLVASCGVDAGVCAGAQQACRDGGFNGCIAADFLANNAAYEPYESKCDTLDNDCDGQTDDWDARIVSDAGTSNVRRAAVGIPIPDAGSPQQRDVLAFYEDGLRVVMRQLRADGTLGPPVIPAQSVLAANKAYGPALGGDGTTVVASWFDEVGAGGSTAHRLFIGLPRPDGQSFISGAPGATPLTMSGPGVEVAVTLAGGRIGLAWQWDESGTNRISVASCPINFSTACAQTTLATTNIRRPRIATNAAGSELYVAYENIAQNRGALVTVTFSATPSPSLTAGAEVFATNAGELEPSVFFEGADLRVFYLANGGTTLRTKICNLPCVAIGGAGGQNATNGFGGAASNTSLARTTSGNWLMAFEQVESAVSVVKYVAVSPGGNQSAVNVSDAAGNAFRPSPVVTATGSSPNFTVLYDTEGATAVAKDVVWARRFCGP